MSLFLPFNFNSGQALTVIVGNFTIPAGKYAFLSAHCTGGATLIIDGVEMQTGGSTVTPVAMTVSGLTSQSDSVTLPNDGKSYFTGHGDVDGNASVANGGVSSIRSTSTDAGIKKGVLYAGPGQSVGVSITNTGISNKASLNGYITIDGADTTQNYWLSEGTILTGTANKTVTLFNIT